MPATNFTLAAGSVPFPLIRVAVLNRLVLALNLQSPLWVRAVANDDYEITNSENVFAYLRTYGPSPINARTGAPFPDQGAGRLARTVGRRMRVYLYTRSGQDIVGGDEIALDGIIQSINNQDVGGPAQTINNAYWPGQDIFEDIVLNALDEWQPIYTDSQTQVTIPLTLGTLHWLDSSDGPAERPKENEVGLVRSYLDFQAVYLLATNRDDPAATAVPTPTTIPGL